MITCFFLWIGIKTLIFGPNIFFDLFWIRHGWFHSFEIRWIFVYWYVLGLIWFNWERKAALYVNILLFIIIPHACSNHWIESQLILIFFRRISNYPFDWFKLNGTQLVQGEQCHGKQWPMWSSNMKIGSNGNILLNIQFTIRWKRNSNATPNMELTLFLFFFSIFIKTLFTTFYRILQ